MTTGPHGEIVIETLGDLRDESMDIVWYCEAQGCRRELGLTLDRAIELWGRDQVYVQWQPPIRCGECGSREISMRIRGSVPSATVRR